MTVSNGPKGSAGRWLGAFARETPAGYTLRDVDPSTPAIDVDARAVNAFQRRGFSHEDRLVTLRHLERASRFGLLDQLRPSLRDQTIGGAWVPLRWHDTGPEYDFDWSRFEATATRYSPENAWGLAILSRWAYEPIGRDDGADYGTGFEALARQGFELQFIGRHAPSTQAVIARKGNLVTIAFRGTEILSIADYARDLNMAARPGYGGMAHGGTCQALGEVREELMAAVRGMRGSESLRIFVTGHSLGGAVATLAALELAVMDGVDVRGLYTYGAPRVLDPEAAAAYARGPLARRTWRFANNTDGVTSLPPKAAPWKYTHVGTHMYFDTCGRILLNPSDRFVEDDRRAAIRRDGIWGKLWARNFIPEQLWDHGPQGYVRHVFVNMDVDCEGERPPGVP